MGSGYTLERLAFIRRRLGPYMRQYEKSNPPQHLAHWRPGKTSDVPDVWVPPEHSLILEIKGAELVTTDQFTAGYCVRFPRVHAVREDRVRYEPPCSLSGHSLTSLVAQDWHESMTMRELHELRARLRGGLSRQHGGTQDTDASQAQGKTTLPDSALMPPPPPPPRAAAAAATGRRRRGGSGAARGGSLSVIPQFLGVDARGVTSEGSALAGITFCVLPGTYKVRAAPPDHGCACVCVDCLQ